jgi:uncharacterized protein (TIGR02996 family)
MIRAEEVLCELMRTSVLAAPGDDAPRLVYADWLDEHGEPGRAEFIRVQCERAELDARLPPADNRCPQCGCLAGEIHADGCRWLVLALREKELADAHVHVWTAGISASLLAFRRGFLHTVAMRADNWFANGDAILAAHPVAEVRLTDFRAFAHTERRADGGGRWCRIVGRQNWHQVPLVNATREDYAKVFAAEWPAVETWVLPET